MSTRSGWLSLRKRAKKKFSFRSRPVKEYEWKKYFCLLHGVDIYYYKKSFDVSKQPKKPIGKINMKHTYLNVILQDSLLGEGFMFRIVPIVIDSTKLDEGLETAIQVPNDGDALFATETEQELTEWVRDILQASALFLLENDSPKNLALKIQESIRDPRKDFKEEDLVLLAQRNLRSKEEDENPKPPRVPGSVNSFTETELYQMEALDCIYSFWKSITLRQQFLRNQNSTKNIQTWWRHCHARKTFVQKRSAIAILQNSWRRHCAVKQKQNALKAVSHRKKIIDELLKTEFSYVDGLSQLISEFRAPMQAMADGEMFWDGKSCVHARPPKKLITNSNLHTLFSNVDSILILHSIFLSHLEKRIDHDWNHVQSCIGDIFTSLADQFKVYIQYVNNYVSATALAQELRNKDPKLESFLKHQSENLPGSFTNLPLESLLILPVQRLPRYELLLRDIIQHTWPEHTDYKVLVDASKKVNEMATIINESKRAIERMEQSLSIQRSFVNLEEDLFLPHRKYIRHGSLMEAERGKNVALRFLFLFSDILIIADQKLKSFSTIVYYECVDTLLLGESDIITIGEHTFNVGTSDGKKSYTFRANSPKEKEEWLLLIKTQTNQCRVAEDFDLL